MNTLTNSSLQPDIFIGIDVDKNSYSFTVKGDFICGNSKKIPADPEFLCNYIKKTYPGKRSLYAYEAGPTGYNLYDYLAVKNQQCLVVSPNSIPKASKDKVKTNRIDSDKLTDLLKAGLLKSIRIPDEVYRELRHIVNIRKNYAKKQKIAKQQIQALLLFESIHPFKERNRWSNRHIQILKNITDCSSATKIRLDALLQDLSYARTQLLYIHHEIKKFCCSHAEIKRNIEYLRSVSGIGHITATYALSRIGNPALLRNQRELGSFAGAVPTEHSTGDTVHKGHITRMGDKTLRDLLIEAAWVAIRKDSELNFFFNRIKRNHHPKIGSRVAIVAVARKLTQRIYKVLKEQRKYVVH